MRLDDDSLDRAIMALPLEEPPPELRASILAATAYRPAPPFTLAEIVAAVTVAAIASWLAFAMGPKISDAVAAAFTHLRLLLWVAVGVGATLWLELLTAGRPAYAFSRRAKVRAKP